MKIAFVIYSPAISGGTFVIYEYVKSLARKGHEVVLVTDFNVNDNWIEWYPEAKEFTFINFKEAENITFDIAIATWWNTVSRIHELNSKKYIYFVQSYEPYFVSEQEYSLRRYIESTYIRGLPVITEATWIKDFLKDRFNVEAKLVKNGIRKDIFKLEGPAFREREPGKLRVLIEGPIDVSFKNVPRTVELCKRANADEIWMLTSSEIENYPGVDKVFSKVSVFDTPLIYRSCDVLVKLSYVEGMFGPPLEMFHCGGTAIVYDVTGHDEYIIDKKNALVVKRDDEDTVVEYIKKLKKDNILLNRLKKGAELTAQKWHSWEKAVDEFEQSLNTISKEYSPSRMDLIAKERFFYDWHNIHNINLSEIRHSRLYKIEVLFRKLKIRLRRCINKITK